MRVDYYIPSDTLKPFIKRLVITENDEEKTYKVLPDTGLVIGFQYQGQLAHIRDQDQIPLSPSGLTGIHDSYRMFRNSAGIGTILVLFQEAGAASFFKQPIHEFFNQSVSLDNFMPRSERLIWEERIWEAKTDNSRLKLVEQFLISRLKRPASDKLILNALTLIHKSKGNIRIKELVKQLHISQSPLEKRFRSLVGTSPKKFASIIRAKHSIQAFHPLQSLTDLGYEAGFYDQAHFIKEFKHFTGETPEIFFSQK